MNKKLSVIALAILASGQAYAEETAAQPAEASAASTESAVIDKSWKVSAELGYVATSGNTETETLNAKIAASTERKNWKHEGEITALNASDADVTTADKYTLTAQSNYKLTDPNYLFGKIFYEDDRFSGYDYRVSEIIGYGRQVLKTETMTLDLEIGPGARQSKLDTGETESEGILYGAAKYNWAVSPTSNFAEVLTVEAGEDVTVTKSVTSLSSQINGSLSMKISYTYKNTSEVPVGIDDTDTETAVTLVYVF